MGYTVQTSLSLRGQSPPASNTQARRNLASHHVCEHQYFTHSAEGRGKKAHQISVVHTAYFPEADIPAIMRYVEDAKCKTRVRIECVYAEGPPCTMLYASAHYIKQLPCLEARALRKEIAEREGSDKVIQNLIATCKRRLPPLDRDSKNMSAMYTDAGQGTQSIRKDREEQEGIGGAMRVPVQVQEGDTQRVPGDSERKNMRHER
jgi:hypothetical protein